MISFLRGNVAWILLSLLLSISLWIVVTFQQDPERTDTIANVPVEVTAKPSTVLIQQGATAIQVTVSAPSDVWPQLTATKFHATVDASKVTPGQQDVPVNVVSLDPRARIESWDPDKISLRVDPIRTKQVPVQVVQRGAVPQFYASGTPKTTPTEVTVSGPQSSVDQVTSAVVEVNLDGITQTIDQSYVPLLETDAGVTVDRVTATPNAVLVEVPVEKTLSFKTVPVQPIVSGNVALGYQIVGVTVDPTTVTLVGDPKTVGELQFVSTQPVNIDGANSDREVSTDLALPGTVALQRSQSVVVRVLVAMADGSKTLIVSPRIVDGGAGVNYSIDPGTVNVELSGPIPVLSHIGPNDVPVVLDAHGAITGTESLRADVTVPSLVQLQGVQPANVTVTVKSSG
jgi:YbbR domain-containing protein